MVLVSEMERVRLLEAWLIWFRGDDIHRGVEKNCLWVTFSEGCMLMYGWPMMTP